MSSESFADLGVSRPILGALAERGITEPFAVQRLCIADVLAGEDVLVQSPTGSGKTLAFGIPMVERIQAEARRPAALVLAPTRELAEQIVDELRSIAHSRALKIAAVYGGVGIHAQAKKAAQAHIVVATPGRLEDLLDRGAFNLKQIQLLVLDEADRMLDIGFKPAIDRIVAKMPRDRQTLFFSATLEGATGKLAAAYTRNPKRHVHAPKDETRLDIEHRFIHLPHEAKVDALVHELRDSERGRTLVFVRTKRGADRLVKRLEPPEGPGGRDARQQEPEPAPPRPRRLRARPLRHPGRHRRRLPRNRRRGHHPRDQLRCPRGSRRLRAPHRPHRPGGSLGRRRKLRASGSAPRHAQDRR